MATKLKKKVATAAVKEKAADDNLLGQFKLPKTNEKLAEMLRHVFELGALWHANDIGLPVKKTKLATYLYEMLPLPKLHRVVWFGDDKLTGSKLNESASGWYRFNPKTKSIECAHKLKAPSMWDYETVPHSIKPGDVEIKKLIWSTIHDFSINHMTVELITFLNDLKANPWEAQLPPSEIEAALTPSSASLDSPLPEDGAEEKIALGASSEDGALSLPEDGTIADKYFALVKKHGNAKLTYQMTDEAGISIEEDELVESDSSKSKYHVFKMNDGSCYCECKAWVFSKSEIKSCKHIEKLGWDTFTSTDVADAIAAMANVEGAMPVPMSGTEFASKLTANMAWGVKA